MIKNIVVYINKRGKYTSKMRVFALFMNGDVDFRENLSFCQIFYKAFLVYKIYCFT